MTDETLSDHIKTEWHAPMAQFYAREAAKYQAKADDLTARGNTKSAARCLKVVARNVRLAEKHESAGS